MMIRNMTESKCLKNHALFFELKIASRLQQPKDGRELGRSFKKYLACNFPYKLPYFTSQLYGVFLENIPFA